MRAAIVSCGLLLAGCRSDIAVSPPAEQQKIPPQLLAAGSFVQMNQTNAARYFVSGIYGLEDNAWRWAGRQAIVKLRLKETEKLKFQMKYAVPRQVIDRNGPVRLRILFNEKLWEELRYSTDGIFEIDKPAPARLLKPDADNLVTIEIDKPLPGENGGPEMGFILVHVGFQPTP